MEATITIKRYSRVVLAGRVSGRLAESNEASSRPPRLQRNHISPTIPPTTPSAATTTQTPTVIASLGPRNR